MTRTAKAIVQELSILATLDTPGALEARQLTPWSRYEVMAELVEAQGLSIRDAVDLIIETCYLGGGR